MTALDKLHQDKRPESNTPVKEDQLLQPSATRLSAVLCRSKILFLL
jgi:hypothetical protein